MRTLCEIVFRDICLDVLWWVDLFLPRYFFGGGIYTNFSGHDSSQKLVIFHSFVKV